MTNVQLDSSKTTFDQLEQKYHNFIAPAVKVMVNNKDAAKLGMAISNVSVDTTTGKSSDMASFTITNGYDLIKRDFAWQDQLQLGSPLEVHMGYTDRLTPLFFGYVSNIEFDFSTNDAPTISVTAMDISFFMMRGGEPQIWSNTSIDKVVRELAGKYGITSYSIKPTNKTEEKIVKNSESDHAFITNQAEKLNYSFFVVGKKLFFRGKDENSVPVMKLEWGKQLTSFRVEHDIADQVTKVVVIGTLGTSKEVVEATATSVKKIGSNSKTGPNLLSRLGDFVEVIQRSVKDQAEARQLAESRMQEHSVKLVTARGASIGLPELRAGRYITLSGLGGSLNTTYYIEKAQHQFDGSGYRTTFTLQGNAV